MDTSKPATNWSLQDYLSLGYLYLLTLGIIKDVIKYGMLDINILSYSTVLDVILSPVIFLTGNLAIPGIILGFFLLVTYGGKWMQKKVKQAEAKGEKVKKSSINYDKLPGNINPGLAFMAFIVLSLYLGAGIGSGAAISKRLEQGTLTPKHELTYVDGETKIVRVIGHNSEYVFYVEKGDQKVSVSPIPGNVKSISPLNRREQLKEADVQEQAPATSSQAPVVSEEESPAAEQEFMYSDSIGPVQR
ncbi:MAG: hypothetical protein AAFR61_06735 [Bacteroidota bacterium]